MRASRRRQTKDQPVVSQDLRNICLIRTFAGAVADRRSRVVLRCAVPMEPTMYDSLVHTHFASYRGAVMGCRVMLYGGSNGDTVVAFRSLGGTRRLTSVRHGRVSATGQFVCCTCCCAHTTMPLLGRYDDYVALIRLHRFRGLHVAQVLWCCLSFDTVSATFVVLMHSLLV